MDQASAGGANFGVKRPGDPDLQDGQRSESKRPCVEGSAIIHAEDAPTWLYLTDFNGGILPAGPSMSLTLPLAGMIQPPGTDLVGDLNNVGDIRSIDVTPPDLNLLSQVPSIDTTTIDLNLPTQIPSISTWVPSLDQQETYFPPLLEWNLSPAGYNSFSNIGVGSSLSEGLPLWNFWDAQQYACPAPDMEVAVTQQESFDTWNDSPNVWYAEPETGTFVGVKSTAQHNIIHPFSLEIEETATPCVSRNNAVLSPLVNSTGRSVESIEQTPADSCLTTPGQNDTLLTPASSEAEACEDMSTPVAHSSSEIEVCQQCDTCFGVVC